MDRIIGGLWGLLACGLLTLILGSCGAHRTLSEARVHYDTVWTVKVAENAKNDSVVYRERVEIVPKLIHVGDTTILHMDTTIVRVTERNQLLTRNIYHDQGRIVRDTVKVDKIVPVKEASNKTVPRWKLIGIGMILGLIVCFIFRFRVRLLSFFRGLAKP